MNEVTNKQCCLKYNISLQERKTCKLFHRSVEIVAQVEGKWSKFLHKYVIPSWLNERISKKGLSSKIAF